LRYDAAKGMPMVAVDLSPREVEEAWKAMCMEESSIVRPASSKDARACLAIYRPYVEDTAITFEAEVPTTEQMVARIAGAGDTHEWLVLEQGDEVLGYAYAHALNPRAAYQWSVETNIYIAPPITASAAAANSTHTFCGGSPSAATGQPSPASPNPTRPAPPFIDPSGSRKLASTGASDGNTDAGTTLHGCSAICSAPPNTTARQPTRRTAGITGDTRPLNHPAQRRSSPSMTMTRCAESRGASLIHLMKMQYFTGKAAYSFPPYSSYLARFGGSRGVRLGVRVGAAAVSDHR
jgi:hypothetical protein